MTLTPDPQQLSVAPPHPGGGRVGFSHGYLKSAGLCAGFTDFSNQRASAAASSGCVTKQTGPLEMLIATAGRRRDAPTVGKGLRLRRSSSVYFMYLARFTDSNGAILIATSGLQVGSAQKRVLTSLPLVSDVKEGQTNWGRKCWGCVCGGKGRQCLVAR